MKRANEFDKALGKRIRERRREIGMTQTTLGNGCGVKFQQIQKMERGINRVSFSRLVMVARTLDCSIPELISGIDPVCD